MKTRFTWKWLALQIVHMENGTVSYQGAPDDFQMSAPELWKTWQNAITLAKYAFILFFSGI